MGTFYWSLFLIKFDKKNQFKFERVEKLKKKIKL